MNWEWLEWLKFRLSGSLSFRTFKLFIAALAVLACLFGYGVYREAECVDECRSLQIFDGYNVAQKCSWFCAH